MENIEELLKEIDFTKYKLIKVNDKILLTNYQIEVLSKFQIDYKSVSSLKELIYYAEEAYEETLDEALDEVINELQERDYYTNTNK